MIKRQILAFVLIAPCALLASEDASTIILGALYALVVSTIIRSTIIGRRFLKNLMRDTEKLEKMLSE